MKDEIRILSTDTNSFFILSIISLPIPFCEASLFLAQSHLITCPKTLKKLIT